MYHFTFIEEASIQSEDKHSETQEKDQKQSVSKVSKPENTFKENRVFPAQVFRPTKWCSHLYQQELMQSDRTENENGYD